MKTAMKFYPACLAAFILAICSGTSAAGEGGQYQSLEALVRMAADHVKTQALQSYPGFQPQVDIRPPDPRLRLSKCGQPEFSLSPGSKLHGAGSLAVRCDSQVPWAISLGYVVKLRGEVLVSQRSLLPNNTVKPSDVAMKISDLTSEPGNYLQTTQAAIGMVVKRPIEAGQPLSRDMIKQPLVIRNGQKVRIQVQKPGFSVSQECTALSNAVAGDIVRCKANNGRILEGIATETGTLEIKL